MLRKLYHATDFTRDLLEVEGAATERTEKVSEQAVIAGTFAGTFERVHVSHLVAGDDMIAGAE